jgi:hypothetical protein
VLIDGDVMFKDVDLIRMTGERYTALVLNATISISGKSLKIALKPSAGHAIISVIEVFEVISAEMTTTPDEGMWYSFVFNLYVLTEFFCFIDFSINF